MKASTFPPSSFPPLRYTHKQTNTHTHTYTHTSSLPPSRPPEDNSYPAGVVPCLEFVLTPDSLVVLNNEEGFKVCVGGGV